MNTSTIKIYKNENFDPNDNVLWDKLDEWKVQQEIANKVLTYLNFQYQKINLEMNIVVPINQSNVAEPQYNFVEIKNSDTSRSFYFWIRKTERGGENSTRLYLTMDTILTFKDLIINHFTHETKIYRQHKDRFISKDPTSTEFYRKIDFVPEVVGLTKYRKTKIQVLNSKKWYLVYANDSEDENTSLKCYLVPEQDDTSIQFIASSVGYGDTSKTFQVSTFATDKVYIFQAPVTIDGNTSVGGNKILIRNQDNTLNIYTSEFGIIATNITSFIVEPSHGSLKFMYMANLDNFTVLASKGWNSLLTTIVDDVLANGTFRPFKAGTLSDINRSHTKLISVIECPYCPLNDNVLNNIVPAIESDDFIKNTNRWFTTIEIEDEFIKNVDTDTLDEFVVNLPPQGSRNGINRNMTYESKLYNSDFYTLKFTYDSFSKEIPLELLEPNSENIRPAVIIRYKQSNTLRSDLGFQFIPYNVNEKFTEDYDEYLICNRQNNCPLYNSNYLNYMRNGYQFDVKNKNQQNAMNWVGTGIQIGAGILGLAASAYTGGISAAAGISLLTSGISSATSNIYSEIKSEQNIEKKKKEAQAQTNSVSASDDLNLLKWYNGNELLKVTYSISDVQKNKIYELLYRCGYACYDVGIPNLNSRILFNYIEADIDLDTKTKPEMINYYADIKERFKKGVTVLHQNGDLTFYCTKENWEIWLV